MLRLVAGALVITAAPAQAQRIVVTDPAGDTQVRGLDIIEVVFANRDRAVVVTLTFTRDRRGDVIVLVQPRNRRGVAIVSRHPRSGPDRNFLEGPGGRVPCAALTSDWNRSAATLRLRMPARCLDGGNYGAVRGWALTEASGGGGDVDYAPERANGDIRRTDSIPRG